MSNKIIRDELKIMADIANFSVGCQHSPPAFVLKWGQAFDAPKGLPAPFKYMRAGECFSNCFKLACEQNLTYVEGYATIDRLRLPIHHAWCIDENKRVIDPTKTRLGKPPLFTTYFGVPFKPEILLQFWNGYLLDDWQNGWPLLKLSDKEIKQGIFG